jgi:Na+/melibiose symporter-like transporter
MQDEQRPVPPVSQLEDVPPEEWSYWSAQAWAGCGVVVALMLAMFLPSVLSAMIGDTLGKLVGFGVSGSIALISIAIISRLTYRKRQERREALRASLAERRTTGSAGTSEHTPAGNSGVSD